MPAYGLRQPRTSPLKYRFPAAIKPKKKIEKDPGRDAWVKKYTPVMTWLFRPIRGHIIKDIQTLRESMNTVMSRVNKSVIKDLDAITSKKSSKETKPKASCWCSLILLSFPFSLSLKPPSMSFTDGRGAGEDGHGAL